MGVESVESLVIDEVAKYSLDPFGYVQFAYPWGEEGSELEEYDDAREWQLDAFEEISEHLENPETRFEPLLLARSSGHGVGKSAFIGMLSNWGMSTCKDCRILITANTEGQLRTKTAPEVSKWFNLSITSHWFNKPSLSIYSVVSDHEKSWRCDFTPWSIANTEAFQGLHNKGKRLIIIFDEASGIPDLIWEVVEGALTDENTEIIWVAFGNPTKNTGRFRECFRKFSKMWSTKKIDSRYVEGTNKKQIEKWRDTYGEESDFFKVRVRGEFPNASASQFYPTDLIDSQRGKHLNKSQYEFAPVILTCDPAWWGDDEIVIGYRQGLYHKILETYLKNDNDVLLANKLARYEDELGADAVFIDQGYGTGAYSVGQTMGRNWQLIAFGSQSSRPDCKNKRAEMLVLVKEWLQEGGIVDPDDELYEELIALEVLPTLDGAYTFPKKDDMKEIIGRSPNKLDQLGLTFALPVVKKDPAAKKLRTQKNKSYNPLKERLK
ncbi:MAG: terminase [Methylophaga sp.]|nr:MAG: terminase [Methylophaga sp.]